MHIGLYIINFFKILALGAGLFCLYAALFLYENQEGRIQNILENVWIRIDDYRRQFLSKQAMFMREVARLTEAGFNRLFGKKLFSLQSIATSACFSMASFLMIIFYKDYSQELSLRARLKENLGANIISLNTTYSEEYGNYFFPALLILTICFLIFGILPLFIKRNGTRKLWFFIVVISVLFVACGFYFTEYSGWLNYFQSGKNQGSGGHTSLIWENPIFDITEQLIRRWDFILVMIVSYSIGIFLGILSDALFIAITRKLLRWASGLDSFVRIVSIILLNCVLALALCFGPALLGFGGAYLITGHSTVFPGTEGYSVTSNIGEFSLPIFAQGLQQIGFIGSLSNVMTSITALAFIALATIMLVHRIFWPLIERSTYALQRIGIAKRKTLFGSLGFILVGAACGKVPAILKGLIETLF